MTHAVRAEVQRASRISGVPARRAFCAWVRTLRHAEAATVCIRIVDEPEMTELNRRFRNRDGATDVLAFPADATERRHGGLGDVVICAPVVRRLAREAEQPLDARFAHATVHGVLHLLGFDHVRADERRAMQARERRILQCLGYPDPYGARA